MRRIGTAVAGGCLVLVLSGAVGCVGQSRYKELEKRYNRDIGAMEKSQRALELRLQDLEGRLASASGEASSWATQAKKWEVAAKALEDLKDRVPDIEIGDGWVSYRDSLLFDPGSATLSKKGQAALDDLYAFLKDQKVVRIRVDGHTDNQKIDKSKKIWKSGSNFELGSYRALAVLLHLEQKGFPGSGMFLASYGEHKPVADNKTKETQAKNRRVQIWFVE